MFDRRAWNWIHASLALNGVFFLGTTYKQGWTWRIEHGLNSPFRFPTTISRTEKAEQAPPGNYNIASKQAQQES
jgi:hypothetical protein